jgi:long-subunit acyl-CoA synthetase (AMP-forming)
MLTPTLKLKRRFINERYQQEIDALYTQPTQLP